MELQKDLQSIGLSQKESMVYSACLQLGIDSVLNIARLTQLKRPTVYLILDELEKHGLVSRVQKEHKMLFKVEPPERLFAELEMKREMTQNILPSLKAIYNIDPEKPTIKIAEGTSGVRNVYQDIFTYLFHHPNEELLIYGSLKDTLEHFETQTVNYFYTFVGKSKNVVREIGNDDHETRKYYRASVKVNPNHAIKLIRNEGRFFQTDNMIYGNNLVIFSVKEQIFVTTIESATICETYRTLFEMAWRSGKPI